MMVTMSFVLGPLNLGWPCTVVRGTGVCPALVPFLRGLLLIGMWRVRLECLLILRLDSGARRFAVNERVGVAWRCVQVAKKQ